MYTIGSSFVILESVDSTNNYAMGKVHAGLARHGNAYFARVQNAGKGQRGKSWKSEPGENIILSCILQPSLISLDGPFMLSVAVALGCYDFVNHYAISDTKIKWPNDIYWRDRKAGGILIENRFHGKEWLYAIVGIGLNINQTEFSLDLPNPVSIKQITGNTYDPVSLAKELCGYIQHRLDTNNFQGMLEDYNNHLYKAGEQVVLKVGDLVVETIINSVNEQGQLKTSDKEQRLFNWGEVEWM